MEEMKIGIIGADTSHVIAFTDLINNPQNPGHIPGGRVVAVFPGGSPDMPISRDRVEGFTKELSEKHNVEICPSIEVLASKVDAVLLESADGRLHLEQFRKIADTKKPVFIDKPFAVSRDDAVEIKNIALKNQAPVFSSSSLRYDKNICEEWTSDKDGPVIGAQAYGGAEYTEGVPGLFWYGIHSAEILFSMMGSGCKCVSCIGNDDADIVVGTWKDGRIGTLRGIRKGKAQFGCLVYRENNIKNIPATTDGTGYYGLVENIMNFFHTGTSPVPLDVTIEIISFLEAANKSKAAGGKEYPCSGT